MLLIRFLKTAKISGGKRYIRKYQHPKENSCHPHHAEHRNSHGEHCSCYSRALEMQYVTDGKRKFIWLPRIDTEQFFDLEADPGELNNLIDAPERSAEIAKWRGFLTKELEELDCGRVVDGKLHCPMEEPMVSPYKDTRWPGK